MRPKAKHCFPARRFLRSILALFWVSGLQVIFLSSGIAGDVEESLNNISTKAATLIGEGHKTEAASLIYDLVQKYNSESFYCQFGTIETCLSVVRQHDLLGEIIRIKRPPEGAPFAAIKDFTITLVHFTSPDAQRDSLMKLNAEQPDDPRILTLLIIATPSDQLDRLIEPATKLKPAEFSIFLKMLTDEMRPYYANEEKFMRDAVLVEWLAKLFASLPPQNYGKADFISVSHLVKERCRFSDVGDIPLPPLWIEGKPTLPETNILEQAIARRICSARDRSLEKLADSLLKHSSISAVGFNLLYRGRSSFPVSDRQLYEASLAAIHAQLRTYRVGAEFTTSGRFTRLSSLCSHTDPIMFGVEFDPFPDEFAAAYAKKNGIAKVPSGMLEGVDPTLAPLVRGWIAFFENPDPVELSRLLAELHADPSSHIGFKIAVLLLEGSSLDMEKGFSRILDQYDFTALLQARPWADGFRTTDRFEKTIGRHYVRHPDDGVASAGLNRLASRLLGPMETWPGYEEVPIHHQGDSAWFGSADKKSGGLSAFAYVTNHRSEVGRIRPNYNLLRFVNTHGLPSGIAAADNAESILNYQSVPALFAEVMVPSNLFVTGPGMFDLEGRFIPPLLVLPNDPEYLSQFGEELLKVRGPQSFRSTITGALWTQRDAAFVLPSLEKELPAIRTWSVSQQHHFAKFLLTNWPPLRDTSLNGWIDACMNP